VAGCFGDVMKHRFPFLISWETITFSRMIRFHAKVIKFFFCQSENQFQGE